MAGSTSKTARQAVRAGSGAGNAALTFLGDQRFLVPLNQGKHAYVRNMQTGKTRRLKTGSDAFVEELRTLSSGGQGTKLRAELDKLAAEYPDHGWDDTIKRLVAADVFES